MKNMKEMEAIEEQPNRLKTWSGIPLREVYTPDDADGLDYDQDLGSPGDILSRGVCTGVVIEGNYGRDVNRQGGACPRIPDY